MAVSRRLSDALHRCHTRLDLLSVHSARCRGSLFFHWRRQMPWLAQRSRIQRDTDPGGCTPWVNRSCSRTVQACALLCGEWAQRFQICIFGEGWLKRVPPPAPFTPTHLMSIYRTLVLFLNERSGADGWKWFFVPTPKDILLCGSLGSRRKRFKRTTVPLSLNRAK